ncbi:transglycosylase SLT domain-containing protein, partial [SAR116 cluster bacterium]|nr:transglycosylase SLT domain-containing protein [SAR116 cluster bacterium]
KRYLKLGDVNMDVGCMQISLKWHSDKFSTLEEAFDPVININYAADFLKKLFSIHKDWNLAIKQFS